MCMSRGCMEPNDDHGDPRHITKDQIDRAAQAADISTEQAAQNIKDCCRQTDTAQGQQAQMPSAPGAPA